MEIPEEENVEKASQEAAEGASEGASEEASEETPVSTSEESSEAAPKTLDSEYGQDSNEAESAELQTEITPTEAAVAEEARKTEHAWIEDSEATVQIEAETEAEAETPVSIEVPEAPETPEIVEDTVQFHEETEETEEIEKAVEASEEAKEAAAAERASAPGFFERLKAGLSKTSKVITDRIDLLLNDYGKIDEELYEELEEILITADIGMETTMSLIDNLKKALVERRISDASQVKTVLRDVMVDTLKAHSDNHLNIDQSPAILFVIGVNGAGKTTTIGKIAHKLNLEGKTVMLAAADTFRAAAIDQLKIWGERSGVPVIAHQEGSDPAAVVYDAIQAAKARKTDVLICDTAGRLHNKKNLMNELAKIFRVIERDYPEAQREVLLVLDATTGQNGLQQAKIFKETAQITGIALTKLDGTAKGGVVLSILHEVEIPVKLIGVGEGLNDLQPFDPEKFVNALLDIS
ncbi:signal recognition particle-docking protein FtsY [Acidaminobacter hydrogenoformans DSM 2784]|uniref:Signal recognition particle receptor FtsY n=2 Tax=Acidaminobacter TaxID=65402 RepID=A0A1G5RSX2_9FIRM|nr:signal recognition particle-docking protein FtsY [Acidaminobacter hydrogenoformans DSM 2784]